MTAKPELIHMPDQREPTSEAWKASILPLYDARSSRQRDYTDLRQNLEWNEMPGCFTTGWAQRRITRRVPSPL